jgi:rhamnogalacturonan endolyase
VARVAAHLSGILGAFVVMSAAAGCSGSKPPSAPPPAAAGTAALAGGQAVGSSGTGAGGTAAGAVAAGSGHAGSGGNPAMTAGASAAGRSGTGGMAAAGGMSTAGMAGTPGETPPAESCVRPDDDPDAPVLEQLGRGVIAVAVNGGVYIGFRLLGSDPEDAAFHVYRNDERITTEALRTSTNYVDRPGDPAAKYSVALVSAGAEQPRSAAVAVQRNNYLTVPLQTQSGYIPGDASAADLDGDGEYELVVKQEQMPLDNSQAGATGETLLEAYELDGTLLWRINLGRNIREGAHYTQFIAYDLDGDGRAEVACKTADGTRDGKGTLIGNGSANHRNADGYVLTGPEFLTVFDGKTGAAINSVDYVPGRGRVADWGDDYGNRVDRFLAGVAYLDGKRPSLIMTRGYYTRSVLVAWDLRGGKLERRWTFDSAQGGNSAYAGQGNHNLSIADIDDDGRQEIVFGGMAVDDDGKGMWTTGYGHGDALHVSDMDEARPGLEVFRIQERADAQGAHLVEAKTGKLIFAKPSGSGAEEGPGRGAAADILASSPGYEYWAVGGGVQAQLWNARGEAIGRQPGSCNFLIYWDADAQRELLDGNHIDKYGASGDMRLLTAEGCASNNGTKSNPALSADLFGDFREELVLRTTDNRSLRIYTTTDVTSLRVPTLMHDPQYRTAIAWQNVAYNQPPHPSFLLGGANPPKLQKIRVACRP